MLRNTAAITLSVLALSFAGCSSGSSSGESSADCGATTFCLTHCSLGCQIGGGCAVNSIAQNQPIVMKFSQNVDPATVNASSISLKTANGEPPTGSFHVSGNQITFMPEVRVVANVTSFGFRPNEQYILTLPGGVNELLSLRSMSGDRLASTVACTLDISGSLVDLNNKAPEGRLVQPTDGERDVPSQISIIVEFDELIDTAPFQGATTASSPINYFLRRVDPNTGECNGPPVLIPGVPQADVVLGDTPYSRVTLRPLIDLPSSVCVEVSITDQVRDLSGTPAVQARFVFFTRVGSAQTQTVTESFAQRDKFEAQVSSADWGNGRVGPGQIGGGGQHGSFDIAILPRNGQGEFIWNTDLPLTISSGDTLLQQGDLQIIDGRAEFTDFVVDSGQTLRFTGSKPPVIRVAGNTQIDGVVTADAAAVQTAPSDEIGGAGGVGGPGGGNGGRGADAWTPSLPSQVPPSQPTAINRGENGADLRAQASSGYAGMLAGTGGRGAPWFPASGLHADVNTRVDGFYSSQQITGAGGGGYLNGGGDGAIPVLLRMVGDPPDDTGPPAVGGGAVGYLPGTGIDAIDHFLVGGSGGGGGGSAPTLVRPAILSPLWMRWTNGLGGGGGGGAMAFRVGRNLSIASAARLSAAGASAGSDLGNTWSSRGSSVGGGGAAGSIVLQVAGSFSQNGTIDLRGGSGGTYGCAAPGGRPGQSAGGNGAPGFVRLEAPGANIPSLGTVLGPNLSSDNVASLSVTDRESIARSTWYPLNSLLPPVLLHYELRVTIDGVPQVFSDEPNNLNPANVPGAPVQLKLQGAKLDLVELQPTEPPGAWVDFVQELSQAQPTGFRFLLILNTMTTSNIEVDEFKLFYQT